MATKYIAKLDGKLVGKRTTQSRKYTHAVVVQYDEAAERKEAYDYVPTEGDRHEFDYRTAVAACEGVWFNGPGYPKPAYLDKDDIGATYHDDAKRGRFARPFVLTHNRAEIEKAKAIIEGGWETYVAHLRLRAIERFEEKLGKGGFHPHAWSWAGRLDLAQKEASKIGKNYQFVNVWIVPAEVA